MYKMTATSKNEITISKTSAFSMGFFGGLGSGLAMMVFTFIGLLLFIPGIIMVMKENKKPKEQRNKGRLITGFVLMGLGMVVGMGFGMGVFALMLGENIE